MSRLRRKQQAAKRARTVPFEWRAVRLPLLGLAAATTALYSPIIQHPFTNYDDPAYILENSAVREGLTWHTLGWAFTHFHEGNWHPLTWLVHAINFQLNAEQAGGHHATSLLLHVINVSLLFLLLARATGSMGRSTVVTALFALHPLNVESVAWAAELKNVLCTLFFLLGIGAYGWYVQKPNIKRYVAVIIFFVLGLASKPMVITFPFVLILLDYWPLGRIEGWSKTSTFNSIPKKSLSSLVLEKLPMIPLCVGSAIITYLAEHSAGAEKFITVRLPFRLMNALDSYAMYVWKAFWPSGLAVFYPHPMGSLPILRSVVAGCFLVIVSLMVWKGARNHGYLVTGWLWYLGTLVPVIGLVQVGGQARADRYAYIPLIGVFVMVVWSCSEIARQRKWTQITQSAMALAVLVALAAVTLKQISYWSGTIQLWTHTLDVTANNQIAEHNLANELVVLHRDADAIPHLAKALELKPGDMVTAANLGAALSKTGRHEEAVKQYEAVLGQTSDPRILLGVYNNLSVEYHLLGNETKAAEYRSYFSQALQAACRRSDTNCFTSPEGVAE